MDDIIKLLPSDQKTIIDRVCKLHYMIELLTVNRKYCTQASLDRALPELLKYADETQSAVLTVMLYNGIAYNRD